MDLMNDPHARYQVIKQDIEELKNEVRENNKKIDMLIQAMKSREYSPIEKDS